MEADCYLEIKAVAERNGGVRSLKRTSLVHFPC